MNFEMDSPFHQPKVLHNNRPLFPQKSLNATNINYEEYRIRTFKSWPVQAPVQADRLARAGFYYLGKGLEVICFSCGGRISDWTYGDIAMQKHSAYFPNCPFVNNRSNNVPTSKRVQEHHTCIRGTSEHNGFHPAQTVGPPVAGTSLNSYKGSQPLNYVSPKSQSSTRDIQVNMKYENERLKTFAPKWPLDYISPVDLARCGFFYLEILDKVQCAFCNGVLTKWEPGDNPYAEHKNNFPLCPFIMGVDVGNVPRGEDICGVNSRPAVKRWMPNSGPENRNRSSVLALEDIGVALHKGPCHPSQASRDARLRSFLAWPQQTTIKGEDLVEAGFFYIGLNDNVKCFYCDGGLNCWEPGDDPWMEHARWFPHCYFVKLNKGEAFIKQAVAGIQNSSCQRIQVSRTSPGSPPSTSEEPFNIAASSSSNALSPIEEMSAESTGPTVLDVKVEEAMMSQLVQAFLRTNTYPAHLVRLAILRKIHTTGSGVRNVDELSEAVQTVRNEDLTCLRLEDESQNQESSEVVESMCMEDESPTTGGQNSTNLLGNIIEPKTPSKTEILEEENRKLKEQCLCKICMDREVGVVFLPCGHLIACVQCAPALTDCALCRTAIKGTIRTFLS